ncbi:MBL fold metallo-hydrolase [Hyphobacterium sp. HN65]|uniref:MBL fold metallo-hydrolase n=1 Tax=Hyphobacterium lacteum TaxID=3116575 RepID=A0ABU7LS35_9PROT|nr:MBL fold metallo-hydrolase [Hyphobacterium sp. HN65]MEE2526716.1 MBL fold metallo-hydrolase [Hyphobacterium sp. HN65]
MKTMLAITLSAGFAAAAFGQDAPELSFENTELRGGVIMMSTGRAGNVGLLVGEDGLLLIDDQLPGTGPQVEAAIAELAGEGVPRFILNTHYHGDHVGSNDHFHAEGSIVAAHHNIRTRLAGSDEFNAEGFLPILTFGDDLHFHMNGETVRAVHVPNAHTDGDAIVYFENADVLHMGDTLFSGLFPFIDLAGGGSVEGYVAAMERAYEMAGENSQVIPGHGPLSTREDIRASIEMVEATRAIVTPMVEAGMSLEEVLAANPLADYHEDWNWGFICTPRMIATLYHDAAGDGTSPLGQSCN